MGLLLNINKVKKETNEQRYLTFGVIHRTFVTTSSCGHAWLLQWCLNLCEVREGDAAEGSWLASRQESGTTRLGAVAGQQALCIIHSVLLEDFSILHWDASALPCFALPGGSFHLRLRQILHFLYSFFLVLSFVFLLLPLLSLSRIPIPSSCLLFLSTFILLTISSFIFIFFYPSLFSLLLLLPLQQLLLLLLTILSKLAKKPTLIFSPSLLLFTCQQWNRHFESIFPHSYDLQMFQEWSITTPGLCIPDEMLGGLHRLFFPLNTLLYYEKTVYYFFIL